MQPPLSTSDLIVAIKQVTTGHYSGKPFFVWRGTTAELKAALDQLPEASPVVAWLDVNSLAEDVIGRLAERRLTEKLKSRLESLASSGCQLLIVTNPYLLHRYEPSAPLAAFWNSFLASNRGVILALPEPVRRPRALPEYVAFYGETPDRIYVNNLDAAVVAPEGGGHGS